MDQQTGVIKAVLFDFDGTLVHLAVDWDRLRTRLQELFAPYGFESSFQPLLPCLEQARSHLLGSIRWSAVADNVMVQAESILREEELQGLNAAELVPGACEVLTRLTERGVPFAVVSNNHSGCIHAAFEKFALPMPVVIIGREDVCRPKPDPGGIRKAIVALGVASANCLLVSDGEQDCWAGTQAGALTALLCPAANVSIFTSAPTFVLAELRQLLALL